MSLALLCWSESLNTACMADGVLTTLIHQNQTCNWKGSSRKQEILLMMHLHFRLHTVPDAVDAAILLTPLYIFLRAIHKFIDITISVWEAVWC